MLWYVAGTWMEELAQRLQQLETQVGQQRAVIEHQQDQLMRQQTTIDADRAARTPVTPIAQDARGNLVDLRVGNKPETFAGETHEWKGWSFRMRQHIAAVDEELYLELVNVEANPLREMPLVGMNEPQKRRARQLAFMLTMHTKDRALQMITKLSDPANGFEIWRRFLQEWEPAHRGRYRAMLMQLLQFPFVGDRGQALEEWERLVRQYEAQSSDTLQDTIKAAMLAHNPQDPEWRRHVGLNATRLQVYDALRSEWKAVHQAYRQWGIADGHDTTPMEVDAHMKGKSQNKGKCKGKEKGKDKDKGKEKGKAKSKDKSKEGTSDTSSVKCFFCKERGHARKDCPKFSAWLAEKKTVGHEQSANAIEEDGWIFALDHEHEELRERIMIDSGASVHVCPPDHGQENGLRKSSETRPLLTALGAEMKQHGMRQVSYDTEVGKITTDGRVLDVRRPIWSLGSMMDSGCDVHFTKNRCWVSKDDGKELDMIRSGGVFFVAARPSKSSSREANTLELNPMTAAEVEQAALARELQEPRWTVTKNPRCASEFPRDQQRPQLKRERCTRLRDTCLIEAGVNGALRRERRTSRI